MEPICPPTPTTRTTTIPEPCPRCAAADLPPSACPYEHRRELAMNMSISMPIPLDFPMRSPFPSTSTSISASTSARTPRNSKRCPFCVKETLPAAAATTSVTAQGEFTLGPPASPCSPGLTSSPASSASGSPTLLAYDADGSSESSVGDLAELNRERVQLLGAQEKKDEAKGVNAAAECGAGAAAEHVDHVVEDAALEALRHRYGSFPALREQEQGGCCFCKASP